MALAWEQNFRIKSEYSPGALLQALNESSANSIAMAMPEGQFYSD